MELAAAALGSALPSMGEIGSAMAADPAMAGITPGMASGVSAGSADALGGLGSGTFVPPSIGGISTSSLMKIPSLLKSAGGGNSNANSDAAGQAAAQAAQQAALTNGNMMASLQPMVQPNAGINFGGQRWW